VMRPDINERDHTMAIPRIITRHPLSRIIALLFCALPIVAGAATFTNVQLLWSFPVSNGTAFVAASLVEASDGVLYGVTYGGGSARDLGGIFKINHDGSEFSVLHKLVDSEGDAPSGALIEATNGLLYGMAFDMGPLAVGSAFRMNKNGSGFEVIHAFSESPTDGAFPSGGLLQASDGALYGSTQNGGELDSGIVFRMDLNGSNFVVLHSFSGGGNDGSYPQSSLIEGTNGSLYGVTFGGGTSNAGTIFRVNKDGTGFSVPHSFGVQPNDGAVPNANIIRAPDGRLYGTTTAGGMFQYGVVFGMDHNGSNYTVLHHFGDSPTDGRQPYAALLSGPEGALYGATYFGGVSGNGTLFKLNPDGTGYAVLVRFAGTNGANPQGALIAGSDGALYGTGDAGGAFNRGAVFKVLDSGGDRNTLAIPQWISPTTWRIAGRGTAGRVYTLQRADAVGVPTVWTNLTTVTADTQGGWQYDSTNPAPSFYRTTFP